MSVVYCSPEDLKSPLRTVGHSARSADDIRNLVLAASRWVDRYYTLVDDAFAQESTATRYFDVGRQKGSVLRLDMPILSLTSITNGDGSAVTLGNVLLLPRNDLPATSLRLVTGSWIASYTDEIEVTGYWGYSSAVPDVIREATAMLTVWMINEYQTRRGVEGKTFDKPGDEPDDKEIPALLQTLLSPISQHLRRLRHL